MKNEQMIKIMLREILCKLDLIQEMLPKDKEIGFSMDLMFVDITKLSVEIERYKDKENDR